MVQINKIFISQVILGIGVLPSCQLFAVYAIKDQQRYLRTVNSAVQDDDPSSSSTATHHAHLGEGDGTLHARTNGLNSNSSKEKFLQDRNLIQNLYIYDQSNSIIGNDPAVDASGTAIAAAAAAAGENRNSEGASSSSNINNIHRGFEYSGGDNGLSSSSDNDNEADTTTNRRRRRRGHGNNDMINNSNNRGYNGPIPSGCVYRPHSITFNYNAAYCDESVVQYTPYHGPRTWWCSDTGVFGATPRFTFGDRDFVRFIKSTDSTPITVEGDDIGGTVSGLPLQPFVGDSLKVKVVFPFYNGSIDKFYTAQLMEFRFMSHLFCEGDIYGALTVSALDGGSTYPLSLGGPSPQYQYSTEGSSVNLNYRGATTISSTLRNNEDVTSADNIPIENPSTDADADADADTDISTSTASGTPASFIDSSPPTMIPPPMDEP